MSHSFMKSTSVTQNLFGVPPLIAQSSHCRTYHCEMKESKNSPITGLGRH
jgi:hypothetical protein